MLEEDLTYRVRGCVYEVYRQLGHGFLEKVYENALLTELALQNIQAASQVAFKLHYKNKLVGHYVADIVVEERLVIEIKAQQNLHKASEAQLLNYLHASGIKVGLLVNFTHPKAEVRRLVV